MSEIVFDIETIPSQLPWVKAEIRQEYDDKIAAINADTDTKIAELSAPKSYKSQEAIAEWMADKTQDIIDKANDKIADLNTEADEKYDKCAVDGARNHIVSIAMTVDDEDPVHFTVQSNDAPTEEINLINRFFDTLNEMPKGGMARHVWIGHNVCGFDLKIIKQRCMILGIKAPTCISSVFNAKPWDNNPYDTMTQWDARNFISMDKIAKALGLEGKGDVDGSQVFTMWKDGKFQEIGEYCCDDVIKTRAIYRRMIWRDFPVKALSPNTENDNPSEITPLEAALNAVEAA